MSERSERIMITAPKAHGCTGWSAALARTHGNTVHQ